MDEVQIRPWQASDCIEELTRLIHRAYRRNADLGFHFVATHQGLGVTRERLDAGYPFLASFDGKIIGTITLEYPVEIPHGEYVTDRPLALFGQFAVDPDVQRSGIGRRLIEIAEEKAVKLGAQEICLDTAQGADHLIGYYQRLGYEIRAEADWRPEVNYKSWVMVKSLA
jgi:predicted N-acetyltransferase YhbS